MVWFPVSLVIPRFLADRGFGGGLTAVSAITRFSTFRAERL